MIVSYFPLLDGVVYYVDRAIVSHFGIELKRLNVRDLIGEPPYLDC